MSITSLFDMTVCLMCNGAGMIYKNLICPQCDGIGEHVSIRWEEVKESV